MPLYMHEGNSYGRSYNITSSEAGNESINKNVIAVTISYMNQFFSCR